MDFKVMGGVTISNKGQVNIRGLVCSIQDLAFLREYLGPVRYSDRGHFEGPVSADFTPAEWSGPDGATVVLTGKTSVRILLREADWLAAVIQAILFGREMSAAPDLLAALKGLVELLPDPELDNDHVQRSYVIAAIAAIAKAEGSNA